MNVGERGQGVGEVGVRDTSPSLPWAASSADGVGRGNGGLPQEPERMGEERRPPR